MALHEDTLAFIMRNPIVKVVDKTDDVVVSSRNEHIIAVRQAADDIALGAIFVLAQRSRRGLWLTEWSCSLLDGNHRAYYRRGGHARTEQSALSKMVSLASYAHCSTPDRFPSRGLMAWIGR